MPQFKITFTPTPGSFGTLIESKLSTATLWAVDSTGPNPTTQDSYTITVPTAATLNVRISSVGRNCTIKYKYLNLTASTSTACCPAGYTLSPDHSTCYQIQSTAPTIIQSNICAAISQLPTQYSGSGSFLYGAGYDLHLTVGGTSVTLLTTSYWKEATSTVTGPMNREGIWVDSDCNGVKDGLSGGSQLQYSATITTTLAKIVYIGIAGDNTFTLSKDGIQLVSCDGATGARGSANNNFNYWHLLPVTLLSGINTFTFSHTGDGTTNDCGAAAIYDNSAAELQAATQDTDLNILFRTSTLRGRRIDIASCPSGYQLDTSGGVGNYSCTKTVYTATTTC